MSDGLTESSSREGNDVHAVFLLQYSQYVDDHYHLEWLTQPQATEVNFCAFFCAILHEVTRIHCCGSCSIWNSLCYDDYIVIVSKYYHLLDLSSCSSKLFCRGESESLHLLKCDFISGSKFLIHVSSVAIIGHKNAEICLLFKPFFRNTKYEFSVHNPMKIPNFATSSLIVR